MRLRRGSSAGGEGRVRWVKVRVVTDKDSYVGKVRLDRPGQSLSDLVSDERAYLGVWGAMQEPSGDEDEFVALHKGAIRYVVEFAPSEADAGASQEA